jgi:hypothetical protein
MLDPDDKTLLSFGKSRTLCSKRLDFQQHDCENLISSLLLFCSLSFINANRHHLSSHQLLLLCTSVPVLEDVSRPDGSHLACYVFLTTTNFFQFLQQSGFIRRLSVFLSVCKGKWHLPLTSFKLNVIPMFYQLTTLPKKKKKKKISKYCAR